MHLRLGLQILRLQALRLLLLLRLLMLVLLSVLLVVVVVLWLLLALDGILLSSLLYEAVQSPLNGIKTLIDGLSLLCQLQLALKLLQGLLLGV